MLLLDGKELACGQELARARRRRNALTMLDAGTLRNGMLDLARQCQLVGMSHKFATQLIGEFNPRLALERVRSLGAEYTIVTAGADGCWGLGPDGILLHQPIFPIEVVDSTGAGDIFHGAWAAALLNGMDWRGQLSYASAAAALGCRFPGGRAGIPTWIELEEFIAQYPDIEPVEVQMKLPDLHIHSTFSDGELEARDAVRIVRHRHHPVGVADHLSPYHLMWDEISFQSYLRALSRLKCWRAAELCVGHIPQFDLELMKELDYVIAGVHALRLPQR